MSRLKSCKNKLLRINQQLEVFTYRKDKTKVLVCVERHSLVGRNHVFTHRYITSRPGQQQVLQISYQAMRTSILVPEKNRSEQKNNYYIKKNN